MRRQRVKRCRPSAVPPPDDRRHKRANCIRKRIQRVARRAHDMRADDLEQNRPPDQMRNNFSHSRIPVILPQTKPAMDHQKRRQGTRDQQAIIRPRVEEDDVTVRLDQPAIGGVKGAGKKAERIKNVREPPHKSASITRPNPKPSKILSSRIFDRIMGVTASRNPKTRSRGNYLPLELSPPPPTLPHH